MKSEIKPGMLCLVVDGLNTGKTCTAVRHVNVNDNLRPELPGTNKNPKSSWIIQGHNIYVYQYDPITNKSDLVSCKGYGLAATTHLLPIEPDETIKSEETKDEPTCIH